MITETESIATDDSFAPRPEDIAKLRSLTAKVETAVKRLWALSFDIEKLKQPVDDFVVTVWGILPHVTIIDPGRAMVGTAATLRVVSKSLEEMVECVRQSTCRQKRTKLRRAGE